jgi:hypothetical protein
MPIIMRNDPEKHAALRSPLYVVNSVPQTKKSEYPEHEAADIQTFSNNIMDYFILAPVGFKTYHTLPTP